MKQLILFSLFFILSNKTMSQNIDLANNLQAAFELDGYDDIYLFNRAERTYLDLLRIDSLNIAANYGLGSLYNNYTIHFQEILRDTTLKVKKKNEKKYIELGMKYYMLSLPYLSRYSRLIKQIKRKDEE